MAKTYTDFSQLSKSLFRREKPAEIKPQPPKHTGGDAEVLAYFSRPSQSGANRPAGASGSAPHLARENALAAELAATQAALAAAEGAKAAADRRAAELEREMRDIRSELDAAKRERDRFQGECGRLAGELRKSGENSPASASSSAPSSAPVSAPASASSSAPYLARSPLAPEPEKPTRGVLAPPSGIEEVFQGEVREQTLAALAEARDAARQSGRERRAAILDGILAANRPSGELDRRRAGLRQVMKDSGSFNDTHTLSELSRLGIRCVSGRKHWKLEYGNVRVPIAKTPSDYRAALNIATDLANRCF